MYCYCRFLVSRPSRIIHCSVQSSPLHALIIGIDEYKSHRINNLRGAAPDADAIADYLGHELHVPPHQIVNLRNEEATRSAIIRELRALRLRDSIRQDDPILIFYAGHGATAPAPPGWDTGSDKISLIVPYDCFIPGEDGQQAQPIPDRTIGAILHELAEKTDDAGQAKGDNIVSRDDVFQPMNKLTRSCRPSSLTAATPAPERDKRSPDRLERGFELEDLETRSLGRYHSFHPGRGYLGPYIRSR